LMGSIIFLHSDYYDLVLYIITSIYWSIQRETKVKLWQFV